VAGVAQRVRKLPGSFAPGILAFLLGSAPLVAQSGPQDLRTYFSLNGGYTDAVVSALDEARKTVLVQAYSFTSAPIAQALVEGRKRGGRCACDPR
jgi:hypothetical protein